MRFNPRRYVADMRTYASDRSIIKAWLIALSVLLVTTMIFGCTNNIKVGGSGTYPSSRDDGNVTGNVFRDVDEEEFILEDITSPDVELEITPNQGSKCYFFDLWCP